MTKQKSIALEDNDTQSSLLSEEYGSILEQIKRKIEAAQARAMSSANRELISVYWDLGRMIYEQQQKANWGDSVVKQLATDLQCSFPGMRGFSSRNLWMMKDFYQTYMGNQKLQTLSAEISWSHNTALLTKCSDPLEREFYMRMVKNKGWSYRVLLNQINNKAYERTLTTQTNFEKNLPKKMHAEAKLDVKD